MGGTPPDSHPGPDSSLSNEFLKAAFGPFTIPSWSVLPTDILLNILQRLELPQAIAFASVCSTWRAAATTAGVPHPSTPWILSWGKHLEDMKVHSRCRCNPGVTCNLYHPADVDKDKSYGVSFPKGCFVACCGASHGWLIFSNNHASLVLYNPVTLARIALPLVTDFPGVEAVYSSEGNLDHFYNGRSDTCYDAHTFAIQFYQKAVLSCSPSKGSGYVVMIIHNDRGCLSFVKAGQKKWRVASTLYGQDNKYLDCAYHKGSFYTVTMRETVEKWHLDLEDGATREVVVAVSATPPLRLITRHLVSTPWGDLLQVCAGLSLDLCYPDGIEFRICKFDSDARKKVVVQEEENVLMDHALFLGLNHSACIPTKNLCGIRPRCIYLSGPGMTLDAIDFLDKLPVWGGVRRYSLETRKFERAIPFCDVDEMFYGIFPSDVWITNNL